MRSALDILDEMISQEATKATVIASSYPDAWKSLGLAEGNGLYLRGLKDARNRVRTEFARDLEAAQSLPRSHQLKPRCDECGGAGRVTDYLGGYDPCLPCGGTGLKSHE